MAKTIYVPRKAKLIDHRSEEGGYYIKKCKICGTTFYPKTSKAKYCSAVCNQADVRLRKKEQLKALVLEPVVIKEPAIKIVPEPVVIKEPAIEIIPEPVVIKAPAIEKQPKVIAKEFDLITDRSQVIGSIAKRGKKTRGLQASLERLKVAQSLTWEGIEIKRVTRCKYEVEQ